MYGQQITVPEQIQSGPSLFNNTGPSETLRNKILVSLILEPQTHFDKNNYVDFISRLTLDNFPVDNGTIFTNTFGDLSVADIPDLKHNLELSSILRPDKVFDVYLESFTSFNVVFNNSKNNMAFKLTFNEFNMNNSSNVLSDIEVLIPNTNKISGVPKTTIYRDKKLYYIATITPDKLSSLSGKISTLDNQTIFRNPSDTSNTDRIIIELILVPR
jgi:hypothetical protein